jgi:cysteine desulfurase/selenocysteine lyase
MNRGDFPRLDGIHYLDSACMSLRPRQVIDKVEEYYTEYPSCPGRSNYSMAERATEELESARESVAELVGTAPENIVLNSGTTEGINTVARGFDFEDVVVSDREHNSNLLPWQERGAEITAIPTDDGFDFSRLKSEVSEGDMVSVVHTSNLDGYTLPVGEIVEAAHDRGARVLVDAAQSVPHQPVDVEDIGADFVAFSGHKMLGPSGTGVLYVDPEVQEELGALNTGGGAVEDAGFETSEPKDFPHRMEAGLPNIAGLVGLGRAAEYISDIGMGRIHSHEQELSQRLRDGIGDIGSVSEVGREAPGVFSLAVDGVDPHQVSLMLDQRDIAVRSGMHCLHSWFHSRSQEPTVRASLHLYNDENDIDALTQALNQIAVLG